MQPVPAKNESDILVLMENWRRELEKLEDKFLDGAYKLSDQIKKVAMASVFADEIKSWLEMETDNWEAPSVSSEDLQEQIHARAHRRKVQSFATVQIQ